ncbi:hypothetical protein IMSAGC022_00559 [Alistipes sp.]|nr:hypothetical protein IMSAGC022_00559 [Alistipes sp.]
MCFWKNLHNFVDMKSSIDFLPEHIQNDLRRLVGLIREEIQDVMMIILYGSYAKNTYVIHDIRLAPNGEITEYHSDYDIMVITRKRLGEREGTVEARIRSRFADGKHENDITKVQLVSESISKLNNALSEGRYFYVDAVNEGIILYDSGECKLATPRELNFSEIKRMAEDYYKRTLKKAERFLYHARIDYRDKEYVECAFFLHQATEYLLKAIPLAYILYRNKEHDLEFLLDKCKSHTNELADIFPRKTVREKYVFDQLCRAYVDARYNDEFVVVQDDVDYLIPKIEHLKEVVEKVCRERIAFYNSQIEKQS